MQGEIIKIISKQIYVLVDDEVIICSQRGKLKKDKNLPLVGDYVRINKNLKVIEEILPRKNMIIRPNVANITQGFIVTSLKIPDFSTLLLDKILVLLEINKIKPVICLTKLDLIDNGLLKDYLKTMDYYKKIGYQVVYNTEINKIKKILENNVTVFIGQTGAGKSTLLNKTFKELNLKTGEVSYALGRGKHTTRHAEIININGIKILDTPGFSALEFQKTDHEEIRKSFKEFSNYPCIYKDCTHIKETECEIKKAVKDGKILKSRYESYINIIKNANDSRW